MIVIVFRGITRKTRLVMIFLFKIRTHKTLLVSNVNLNADYKNIHTGVLQLKFRCKCAMSSLFVMLMSLGKMYLIF